MATLHLPDTGVTLTDFDAIRKLLAEYGVFHTRWAADQDLALDADQDTILAAYATALRPFMAQNGYRVADVINVHPGTPNLPELRAKFLREHTHTEDEVRFFVDGQGLFWFNPGPHPQTGEPGPVMGLLCTAGDLISVPANMKHWFDLGPVAHVKAIRIFIDTAGWVPHYTDSGIDTRYDPAAIFAPSA